MRSAEAFAPLKAYVESDGAWKAVALAGIGEIDHPEAAAFGTLMTVRLLAQGFLAGSGFYSSLAHVAPFSLDSLIPHAKITAIIGQNFIFLSACSHPT